MYRLIFTLLGFVSFSFGYTQADVIKLKNGSFEDNPRAGGSGFSSSIKNWYDCGEELFKGETPPDIHPVNYWQVTSAPADGETYLGMVVRDNDSWESVGQRLSEPIEAGKCYSFSVFLSRSDRYVSASRMTGSEENYTTPTTLRVWGGSGFCSSMELLATSAPISNKEWKKYQLEFSPKKEHRFIMLEAFYKTPVLFPYNGHILLDGASDITRVACAGEDYVAAKVPDPKNDEPKEVKPRKDIPAKETIKADPVVATATPPKKVEPEPVITRPSKPKLIEELDRKTLKRGQTINIKNLYFDADTSSIDMDSKPILDELYDFLNDNQDIYVEVGGHTNGNPGISHKFCDQLSTERAKAVAGFLVSRGIQPARVKYKGYGKRKPIASNFTKEGRKKNQRVEVKILSLE